MVQETDALRELFRQYRTGQKELNVEETRSAAAASMRSLQQRIESFTGRDREAAEELVWSELLLLFGNLFRVLSSPDQRTALEREFAYFENEEARRRGTIGRPHP